MLFPNLAEGYKVDSDRSHVIDDASDFYQILPVTKCLS